MSARDIAGGYTLAAAIEKNTAPDSLSQAVVRLGELRERYALSQICGMEMDQKTRLTNMHAATMEMYDREVPSHTARKKAVVQSLTLDATSNGPPEPPLYPSLKDHMAKRQSYSGTGPTLTTNTMADGPRSQTLLTADPPRPGEKPISLRSASPGPRRSLNGTVQQRMERLGSARSPARHSESGTGASPKRAPRRSESGIVMTAAQRNVAEAPAPQADVTLESAISPQAILSRIERRYSSSGSHSLSRLSKSALALSGKLLTSAGQGALQPSNLRLIAPTDEPPPGVAVRHSSSGRPSSSLNLVAGPTPPESQNRLSNLGSPTSGPLAEQPPYPRSSLSGSGVPPPPRRSASGNAGLTSGIAAALVPGPASSPGPTRPTPPPMTQKPSDVPTRRWINQVAR